MLNRVRLFKTAWRIYRKGQVTFSQALRLSWINEKAAVENAARIETARKAAGIQEEAHSWAGWKALGREVVHGAENVFQVLVIDARTKTGSRVKSYFTLSQTEPVEA